jgi:Protein of unknown function (DUF642)
VLKNLIVAGVFMASAGLASAANLLVNGSFENPAGTSYAALPGSDATITGWTTLNTGVEWFNPLASYPVLGAAADGVMVVDLANTIYSSGGIQQTFYNLSFSLSTSTFAGRGPVSAVDVTVAGNTSTFTINNSAVPFAWTPIAYSFQASGATTTLSFNNTQDAYTHFAFVDGVSVTAVPEPGEWALMLSGLAVVAALVRRRRVS